MGWRTSSERKKDLVWAGEHMRKEKRPPGKGPKYIDGSKKKKKKKKRTVCEKTIDAILCPK